MLENKQSFLVVNLDTYGAHTDIYPSPHCQKLLTPVKKKLPDSSLSTVLTNLTGEENPRGGEPVVIKHHTIRTDIGQVVRNREQ